MVSAHEADAATQGIFIYLADVDAHYERAQPLARRIAGNWTTLSPAYIDTLVDDAIAGLVDHEAWEESLDHERDSRELLRQTAQRFGG